MRGKRAKSLRALAQSITVGKPERVYEWRWSSMRTGRAPIQLRSFCTRRVYQLLKKGVM